MDTTVETINENNQIKTIYINQSEDAKILTTTKELNYPSGKNKFIELSINHFSPYILYDEIIRNPQTSDNIAKTIFIFSISLIGIIVLIIKNKSKTIC